LITTVSVPGAGWAAIRWLISNKVMAIMVFIVFFLSK
jgi:hypothetical protein